MNKLLVRFHLANGPHYKHWQVKDKTSGGVSYYDPTEVCLLLTNCRLVNQAGTALRVFQNQVRDVCGWIECNEVSIVHTNTFEPNITYHLVELVYDPKIHPHWFAPLVGKHNCQDGIEFQRIITKGRRVFTY
jgi:hypothetical protein